MQQETPKKLDVEVITNSRMDLFNISAMLMKAIDDTFLTDAAKPVTVAVNGTFAGGKSIFPDAARHVLMSGVSHLAFKGLLEEDEFWYGLRNGHKFEFGFTNTNRSFYYGLDEYLGKRKFGGVSFVHNTDGKTGRDGSEAFECGIEIWLESGVQPVKDLRAKAMHSPLAAAFRDAIKQPWGRYVSITVHDERLSASLSFNRAMKAIEAGEFADCGAYGRDDAAKWYVMDKLVKAGKRFGVNTRNLKTLGVGK